MRFLQIRVNNNRLSSFARPNLVRLGAEFADRAFFRRDVDPVARLGSDERSEFESVVESNHPAVEPENNRERPGNQRAGIDLTQSPNPIRLLRRHSVDVFPMRSGENLSSGFQVKTVTAVEQVKQIRDNLGVCLELAGVSVHLDVTAVGVVRGNLAVVNDGSVQQRKRMRSAPPSRRVGWEPAVRRPQVRLVLFQTIKAPDVFRIADALENAHVLPAGENIRAVEAAVDLENALSNVLLPGQFRFLELVPVRLDEIPPDFRLLTNRRRLFRWDSSAGFNIKMIV